MTAPLALAVVATPLVWLPGTIEVYLFKGLLLGLLGVVAVALAAWRAQGRTAGWAALPVLLLAWAYASRWGVSDPFRADLSVLKLAGPVLIFTAALLGGSAQRIERLLDLALAPAGLLAAFILLRYLGGYFELQVDSPLGHRNRLAGYLAIALVWAAYRALTSSRALLALVGLLGVGLLVSGTRGAWLGAAGGLAAMGLVLGLRQRELLKPLIKGGLLALAAVALVVLALPYGRQVVGSQTRRLISGGHSVQVRRAIWPATVTLSADRPFGFGAGQFPVVYPQVRPAAELKLSGAETVPQTPHSDPLLIAIELGWLALVGCVVFWIWLAIGPWRERSAQSAACAGMLVAATLHGSVSALLFSPGVSQLPALAAAHLALSGCATAAGRIPFERALAALATVLFCTLPLLQLHQVDRLYERARQATSAAEAGSLAERALTRYPRHAPTWFLRGRLALRAGDAKAAHVAFGRYLELNPGSLVGRNNQALAAWGLGRTTEARQTWQRLVDRTPTYDKPRKNLAQLHRVLARRSFDQSHYEQTIEHCRALFKLDSGSPRLRYMLGISMIELRDTIRGLDVIRQALREGLRLTGVDRNRKRTGAFVRALERERKR